MFNKIKDWDWRIRFGGHEVHFLMVIFVVSAETLWLIFVGGLLNWLAQNDWAKTVGVVSLGLGGLLLPLFLFYGLPWKTRSPPRRFQSQAEASNTAHMGENHAPEADGDAPLFQSEGTVEESPTINNLRRQIRWWEYRFLNLYLVPGTQLVLDWLRSSKDPVSLPLYHHQFMVVTPSAKERTDRLVALEAHFLIHYDKENLISITDKGKEYLEWRGPYPYEEMGLPDMNARDD